MSAPARHRLRPALLGAALVVAVNCGGDPPPTGIDDPPPDDTPTNAAPVASAGVDQTVSVGLAVRLDGTASSDADGDAITYSWTLAATPTGSGAALDDGAAAEPSFVPDVAGSYTVRLVVNDGTDDSVPDEVTITAADNTATETIGVGGGTVVSTDGRLTLDVPQGAVAADTDISVTLVPADQRRPELEELDGDDILYDLQPSGLQFSESVAITTAVADVVTEDGDALGVEASFAFVISEGADGLELEQLQDLTLFASRGETELTLTGSLSHFSNLVVVGAGATVTGHGVPATLEVGETVAVTVTASAPRPVLPGEPAGFVVAPTQTDGSEAPFGPEAGFAGTFDVVGQADGSQLATSAENAYGCSDVGNGVFRTTVDVRVEIENDPLIQLFVPIGNPAAVSQVTLEAPVECTAPPPPPVGPFSEITAGLLEGFAIFHGSPGGTRYGIAHDGGIMVFDDHGTVADEILANDASLGPLLGVTGNTDAAGVGSIIAYGDGGASAEATSAPGTLARISVQSAVTNNDTRITDAYVIEIDDGLGPGPRDRYALAQFEERNILFLEEDGAGGFDVVPGLDEAFVQNGVSIFGTDRPLSLHIGPNGFDENNPMLVLTIGDDTFGDLNIVSLKNGVAERAIVPDFTSLIEPRRLRCDDTTGICGMSSFRTRAYGGIYTFQWDGQDGVTPLTPRLSFAPVGIDVINTGTSVLMTGTDTRRFVDGAYRYHFRVVEYDLDGTLLRSGEFRVPVGCVDPFHAVFRRRVPTFDQVLLSCQGDAQNSGRVVAATFALPTS